MFDQSNLVGVRAALQLSDLRLVAISRGGGHLVAEYKNEMILIPHHLTGYLFRGETIDGMFTKKYSKTLPDGVVIRTLTTFTADKKPVGGVLK